MNQSKAVVVVNETLPIGLKANVASVLCMSLGRERPEVVGETVVSADGVAFPGITRIPVPILTATAYAVASLRIRAADIDFCVAFTGAALTTKTYDEYRVLLSSEQSSTMDVHGVLLFGERKAVNKLVGQFPLLR